MRAFVWKDGDTLFGVGAWKASDAASGFDRCVLSFLTREDNVVESAAVCTGCCRSSDGSAVDTFVRKTSDASLGGLAWKRAYTTNMFKRLLSVGFLRWERRSGGTSNKGSRGLRR